MKYTIGEWMDMYEEVGNENNVMNNERVFDSSIELKDNALLKHRPELFYEWDFDKNNELGLDVYKVTKGSTKRAHWLCVKCKSPYFVRIDSRMRSDCGYCAGQKVNHTNSLASLRPDIASQWHPTLNGKLLPDSVTKSNHQKVWWLGGCGHEWDAVIADRTNEDGYDCPFCSNRRMLVGFNDMWTTNPILASQLLNPKDGYNYTQGSKVKLDWKCLSCRDIVKNKIVHKVLNRGISCPRCSDGFSVPEKIMSGILSQLGVEFEPEKSFNWIENRRYDFYLPEHNMIIETHGKQHYKEGFKSSRAKTLEDVQENDKYKRKKALDNGILHYVEIDCRRSEIEYIKLSILNTIIIKHFNLSDIDWDSLYLNAIKSRVLEVCSLYNNNSEGATLKEMSQELKIHESTFKIYLTRGSKLGLCEYAPNSQKIKLASVKHMKKSVVQLGLNGEFVKEWNSISSAGAGLGKTTTSSISACCKGKAKTTYGFKWMYKEEYDELISNRKEIN